MKTVLIFWWLAALLVPGVLMAQVKVEDVESRGLLNGKYWTIADASVKGSYIVGFLDGMAATCSVVKNGPDCIADVVKNMPNKTSRQGLADAVDQFYAEQANVRIPLRFGILWVSKRLAGGNIAELDSQLSALRSQYK